MTVRRQIEDLEDRIQQSRAMVALSHYHDQGLNKSIVIPNRKAHVANLSKEANDTTNEISLKALVGTSDVATPPLFKQERNNNKNSHSQTSARDMLFLVASAAVVASRIWRNKARHDSAVPNDGDFKCARCREPFDQSDGNNRTPWKTSCSLFVHGECVVPHYNECQACQNDNGIDVDNMICGTCGPSPSTADPVCCHCLALFDNENPPWLTECGQQIHEACNEAHFRNCVTCQNAPIPEDALTSSSSDVASGSCHQHGKGPGGFPSTAARKHSTARPRP